MRKLITTLLCSVMLLCNAAYGFSQNYDVRTKSDITAEQLNAKLQNRLKGTGCYFIAAQEEYGVNAQSACKGQEKSKCRAAFTAVWKGNFGRILDGGDKLGLPIRMFDFCAKTGDATDSCG